MAQKIGVLLLHGLTGVPSEMRPVEKYLQRIGCDTECPTLAGHDSTNDALLDATWQDWIESAQQGLDRLAARVDQVIVCGLSMGGSIAAILASRNDVAGVILLSPTLAYDSPDLDKPGMLFMRWASRFRDSISRVLDVFPVLGRWLYWTETPPYGLKDERLQRQITKAIEAAKSGKDTKFGLFRTYWISLSQMIHVNKLFRTIAAKISRPTLLMSSLEDTLVSLDNATTTYRLIGNSNKSLVMLTGCDHVLTLDLKRNYVCKLIGEFLEAVVGLTPNTQLEADIGLTAELHNRLNPLSNKDWSDLVPGSPSLTDLAEALRQQGMHESACHTLVFCDQNVPLLMVPLIIDQVRQSVVLAIPESQWGKAPVRSADALKLAQAWKQCDRICKALYGSYNIKHADYLSPAPAKQKQPV
jgi:carboxylesterase